VARTRRRCLRLPSSLEDSHEVVGDVSRRAPYRESAFRVEVRWEATRCATGVRFAPVRPSLRGCIALAVTLLVHALPWLLPGPSMGGCDFDAIDRDDGVVLLAPLHGTFPDDPEEPPYGESLRFRKDEVQLEGCHIHIRRLGNVALCGGPPPGILVIHRVLCLPFPYVHEVADGETLASIAQMYGISDWHVVYRDPGNTRFTRTHPDPNRIFPGDRIVIPPPDGEVDCEPIVEWF
jgi:hypothetical protein